MVPLQASSSPLITSIAAAAQPWQTLYSEHTAVSTAVLFVHLAALVLSAGLAVATDRAMLATHANDAETRVRRLDELAMSHRAVIGALVLSFASGMLLLLADFEAFVGMRAFWIKLALIVLLIANASLMRRRESQIRSSSGNTQSSVLLNTRLWAGLRRHAWTSVTLWFAIVLAGTAMTSS